METREIRREIIRYIDDQLEESFRFQAAMRDRDPFTMIWLGCQTLLGGGHPSENTATDLHPWPWTANSGQTLIAWVEAKLHIKSPIPTSEHARTVARLAPPRLKRSAWEGCELGDLAIWGVIGSEDGQLGICEPNDKTSFFSYEGNTEWGLSDTDGIIREGDGFSKRKRSFKGSKRMELLGFWRPFDV